MLRHLKKITLILVLALPVFCSAQIYLLGFQRSGNHLLTFSLAHILDLPVIYFHRDGVPAYLIKPYEMNSMESWYLAPVVPMPKKALYNSHFPKALKLNLAHQSKDYLIVVIRDYHECLLRKEFNRVKKYDLINPDDVLKNLSESNVLTRWPNCFNYPDSTYVNVLECYDNWNENTRHLIYYEDLITNFEETIQKCLDKLNITRHKLNFFMNNYNRMMAQSKELYRKYEKATLSGDDVHYHQKHLLTPEVAKEFDAYFRDHFPDLWEKYLKRYECID